MTKLLLLQCMAILLLMIASVATTNGQQQQQANNSVLLSKLQSQMSAMKTDVTKQFQDLKAELKMEKSRVAELENERNTRNSICHIKHDNRCGGCLCVEDYNLLTKFFCDCRAKPSKRDCKEHHANGERINGLYHIHKNLNGRIIQVFCDQTTDGGGWTVVQRRMDGSQNFYRNWTEYKTGFGKLHEEHWLGNENIYLLTAQAFWKGSELRFDLKFKGQVGPRRYAKYSSFDVNNEASGYHLFVSGYSGTAGNYFSYHDGTKFSTYDRDNDQSSTHCAKTRLGGFWYKNCAHSDLNSPYDSFEKLGYRINWIGNRLTFSEMKVRRK